MKPLMAGLGIVGATMARRLRHGKLDAVCCNRRGLVVDVFMLQGFDGHALGKDPAK